MFVYGIYAKKSGIEKVVYIGSTTRTVEERYKEHY